MPKKKKETTGLLMAITPVTVREEKNKGGLLDSDRQGYAEGSGNPIPIEDDWSRRGIESTEGGSTVYTQDDSKSVLNPIPMTDDWTKRGSYKNNQGHTVYFQESGSKGIEKYIIDNNNNKIETTIPIEDDWIQRGSYQDRGGNTFIFQETGEGLEIRKEDDSLREIIPRSSPRFKEALTEIGAGREEREGNKGGGLLNSDRQRYQEGSEVPVPSDPSDYPGPRDYDPIEFEDLNAMPRGATGEVIAEQRRLRESLLMSLDNLMDTEARMIVDNPGYTEEVRGLLRPFTDSISPFEKRINEVYTNYDNAFSRENVDNPYPSRENMQKEILRRVEIFRQLQEESAERETKQEGGVLEEAPMEQPMAIEEAMPMETPISMEQPMVPDEQMEDNYLDFIISKSLEDKEEVYLMDQLEADPQLSIIFDKLMNTATEFAGSGPVEGPGSEVSDSIPARLSDGEFVLTAKATDEIGSDNIEAMMQDAEARSDKRQLAQTGGVIRSDLSDKEEVDYLSRPQDEEIRKGMLSINPLLQQRR